MANQQVSMGLALILATIFIAGAGAQSDCTDVLVSLSPCVNYISGNASGPSSACCTHLGTVVGYKPQCLCEVLNGGGSNLGITINQTKAMAMPQACKVQTPSASLCNGTSPSGTSGGGSRTGPSSSDATSTGLTLSIMLFFLIIFTTSILNMP